MSPRHSLLPGDVNEEIPALIDALHESGQRLEELTGGEVDGVTDGDGRTFLLQSAQDQLRHSEAVGQAAILNALPAHIALLDAQGFIISVNEAWRRFAGANAIHGPGYGIGRNYLDICDSARGEDSSEAHHIAEGIRSVLDGRVKCFSNEYPCHSPTEQRWFLLKVTPLADDHRGGAVVMHLNVTAERQTSESLHASELRFRQMAENILDVFFLTSAESNHILYVSPAYEAIWGRTCESLYAQPLSWTDAIHPEDREQALCSFQEGAKSGRFDYQYRIVRPDGEVRWIRTRGYPINDSSGTLIRIASIAVDISERKKAEAKLDRINRVYAILSGINSLIVRVRNRQELFNEACRIAVEHGNFGTAWIGLFDSSTLETVEVAWSGRRIHPAGIQARADVSESHGVASRAIREKQVVFDNDIAAPSSVGGERRPLTLQAGFRSMVALPFMVEGAVVGHLSLYAKEPDFFNEDELKLLSDLAGNISFALENISRQQQFDKLARIRAVSSEINAVIIRVHDREALLRETCRIAVERGKFELVWIAMLDHEKQKVQAVAWTGFSPEAAHAVNWATISATHGTLGAAILTRKPAVSNDIEAELPVGKLRREAIEKGCLSTMCLPLVVDDNVVALIALFAPGVGFFVKEELALLNEVAADVSFALQAIEKQKQLDYLAYYDALTGLANRSLFLERVAQYMRSAVSGGHKLALYLIDLERFKNINDSLGQPAGDALLRQVAEWLTCNAGDANLLARVGADHFAAVLPEVKQEGDVARLLEKSMAAFLAHPFRLNDAVFRIAAKVGVALSPDDGADADTLFRHAEAALKKAKASGERCLFYTQTMTAAVAGTLTLENQLRQALDKGEFVLHYQPKVNLVSGKLTGAEALIRWNDPRTGLVPPDRFIPVLEETGLIYDVGRWALCKAIEDYLRWRAAGLAAVRIAVNVSPLQLRNRGFIAEIKQAIDIDAHAAAGLELEITESLIMADVKHSITTLQAIRAMDVSIAIDDFGTGFSSLSYLSKLPVDTLKIDRSFVSDMTVAAEGMALVSTIINLGHSLNLKVVAEGVETEEQSRLLRLLRCDEAQGYLFSKPVPVEDFETRFLTRLPPGDAI